jgi:hypothetical protein
MQNSECESSCAAEISVRTQVGRWYWLFGNQVAHPIIVIVVDHDEVVDHPGLGS